MQYTIRHRITTSIGVIDVSPADVRHCLSIWIAAYRMQRRIYKRFGSKPEMQRYDGHPVLWRPGEEIELIPNG